MNCNYGRIFYSKAKKRTIKLLKISKKQFGVKRIISNSVVNDLISNAIKSGEPYLVSRFGTTETNIVLEYIELEGSNSKLLTSSSLNSLFNLSGVFPVRQDIALKFCEEMVKISGNIDLCGVRSSYIEQMFWESENKIVDLLSTSAVISDIDALTPLASKSSWVDQLYGKKVLIIHPFADTIKIQYAKRSRLHKWANWLPEFEILTMQPVQSLGLKSENSDFEDWFSALASMKNEISKIQENFNVALIGAGAYGMFLGSHVKDLGKPAVHIGGSLQLFFGINGNRWNSDPDFKKLGHINDNWVFPSDHETPKNSNEIENSAYWQYRKI